MLNYKTIEEPKATVFMLALLPWTHTQFLQLTEHKVRGNGPGFVRQMCYLGTDRYLF